MRKKFSFNFSPSLTKDFVLIYRISLIGIFIVGCLFIKFSIDQEKQKIAENLTIAAEQINKSITYNIDYLKYQLYYATKQVKAQNIYTNDKRINDILSSFVGNINNQVDIFITWNAFSWVNDKHQLTVDGAGGIIKHPVDLSKRDYIQITSKVPNKLVFGKPISGALSERLIIPVGMGVFSDDNKYLGTLVFGLDVERILGKLENMVGNETYSFAVMHDENISFASSSFSEENHDLTKKIIADYNQELLHKTAKELASPKNVFAYDSQFYRVESIKNSPLKILILYNKEKSRQQIFNILFKHSFLIFLVVFSCMLLFQKIYRRIVRPIKKLSQLALKISRKDFTFAIEKPSSKELIDLYNTLNLVKDILQREETLLKQLELTNVKLAKANEAKAEFLAKSSHDIKNYVFGINGLSHLILENNEKSPGEERQMVETIADQSEELMHFVEDLLDTNQLETGEFSLEKIQICDISAIIERIVLLNKSLAIRHDVLLVTNLEKNLPKLKCDPRRMKQILVNLVTNAIKYSLAKTTVTISAEHLEMEKQIYIEIADQGIGMTEEEAAMALEGLGKNIDKPNLENVDSHGIGMVIVLKLVKLHHGRIEIDSKKGVGTKVKLYFDAVSEGEIAAFNNITNFGLPHKERHKSILLVEDNPVNIKITTKILRDVGHKVCAVPNGKEALEVLDQQDFDLILMDGEMPVMSGFEATKKIRDGKVFTKFKNFKSIPIIALMASSDKKTIQRAIKCGANETAEKSISHKKLLEVIDGF